MVWAGWGSCAGIFQSLPASAAGSALRPHPRAAALMTLSRWLSAEWVEAAAARGSGRGECASPARGPRGAAALRKGPGAAWGPRVAAVRVRTQGLVACRRPGCPRSLLEAARRVGASESPPPPPLRSHCRCVPPPPRTQRAHWRHGEGAAPRPSLGGHGVLLWTRPQPQPLEGGGTLVRAGAQPWHFARNASSGGRPGTSVVCSSLRCLSQRRGRGSMVREPPAFH